VSVGTAGTTAATRAFDRLAPMYDTLAGGEIFTLLRRRTHATFAPRFPPGSRVLEIGCGTGLDTRFLARRGVQVVACDPSEAMVARALCGLARDGLAGTATIFPCGLQELAAFLDATTQPAPFDGIVSNFGALNCVEHLAPLGALGRRYVRPGGVVLLGLMGRHCACEMLYFAARGRTDLARRRTCRGAVGVPVAGIDVPTFYHRIADARAALGRDFTLTGVDGIGVLVPPPYLEPRWQRLSKRVRTVTAWCDALVASCPPFNRLGDHVLLELTKRSGADA
jgi:SAM-dependent methyltransferase